MQPRSPTPDLHDKHGGGLQPASAEGDEDERSIAELRCSMKAAVSGDKRDHEAMDATHL